MNGPCPRNLPAGSCTTYGSPRLRNFARIESVPESPSSWKLRPSRMMGRDGFGTPSGPNIGESAPGGIRTKVGSNPCVFCCVGRRFGRGCRGGNSNPPGVRISWKVGAGAIPQRGRPRRGPEPYDLLQEHCRSALLHSGATVEDVLSILHLMHEDDYDYTEPT